MAIEIERKFLVKGDFSAEVYNTTRIVQGYICTDPERNVRIRIRGEKGFLTIKGKSDDDGLSRFEFEKEISLPEAEMLLQVLMQRNLHYRKKWLHENPRTTR